jgi:hypothetical protein
MTFLTIKELQISPETGFLCISREENGRNMLKECYLNGLKTVKVSI